MLENHQGISSLQVNYQVLENNVHGWYFYDMKHSTL